MNRIALLLVLLVFSMIKSYSQSITKDSLDIKIGQMIMIGIGSAKQITNENPFFKAVKEEKLGGVLLYEKNITKKDAPKKLRNLIKKLKSASKTPLLISIDEEGGKVNRLKKKYGFPKTVSAKYLGKVNDIDSTKFYSDLIAHNLLDLGINVNYAPVVDLHNDTNPPLGKNERCFSTDPQEVINHAREVIKSHRYFNIKTVLKHFPGHGNSTKDSHYNVTDVSRYWKEKEVFPYIKLLYEGNVDAIMTAHIINDKLDESKIPATLSKKILTGYLRNQIGFDGVIFSDDMQMKAISDHFGFEKAIKMSILAGVDILMFSNHIPTKDKKMILPENIIKVIKKMIENKEIPEERISESYKRIMKFKENL